MRRFSPRRIGEVTGRTVRRFPLALAAGAVAGVVGTVLVDSDESYPLLNLLLAAQLGIPLFLAAATLAERREHLGLSPGIDAVVRALGVLLLLGYFLTLPRDLGDRDWLLFVQLNVGLHFLVAFAPYLRGGQGHGLWQYNLSLLGRFLTAAFFSMVLYAGLSVAVLALDTLLGVDVGELVYVRLWILIAFVFNTTYFLGGVPQDFDELQQRSSYPKVVRVFAQFILAPLVAVYLGILLAYLVKVVVTTEWPSGWIGYLVSSVAAAGFLSLLLLKPLSEREDVRWVRVYARLFHVLMVPAVAMLLAAIFKRVAQYGVTEMRFFLIVLAGWLAAMVVTGSLRRQLFLKAIPMTLCALAFVTAFGPWSAYDVSRRSQLGRLDQLLAAQQRLAAGVIVPDSSTVSPEDGREISAALDYLFGHFGPEVLGRRTDDTLRTRLDEIVQEHAPDRTPGVELTRAVGEYANVVYVGARASLGTGYHQFLREDAAAPRVIRGYDFLVEVDTYGNRTLEFRLDADSLWVTVDWDSLVVSVARGEPPVLRLPLGPLLTGLRDHEARVGGSNVPDSLLTVDGRAGGTRASLRLDSIEWSDEAEFDGPRILTGVLLLADEPVE